MKTAAGVLILCLAFVAGNVPRTTYAVRPQCRDTFIKRVESPDGQLAVYLYHKECTSVTYTCASLRTRPTAALPDGDVACYLVSLRGRLKIEAVWKDAKNIHISSPDLLAWDLGVSSQKDSCNDIKISYDLNIERAPPEETEDPEILAAIRKAIEMSDPCLSARGMGTRMFYCRMDLGEHRSAVSLLLMHLYDNNCPVSQEAYALLKKAGKALEVEPSELEDVLPMVTTSARAEAILSLHRRQAEAAKARIRRRPPGDVSGPPQKLFYAYLDHRKVFIDGAAQLVVEPQIEETIDDFSDGMAKVTAPLESSAHNTKYGYMDATGKVVIPPQFERASDFHEGLAWAETKMWLEGPSGFIDKTGKIVIPFPKQSDVPRFSAGLAAVSFGGAFGYIDKTGKTVIEPRFSYAGPFREGLAWVRLEGDKGGYIDKTGRLVIGPADYELWTESSFSEGLAMVKVDHKTGYIDRTGQMVIAPQFYNGYEFSDGLARVSVDGKEGYIDKSGRMVVKAQYEHAYDFSEGLAAVEVEGKYGFIDTTGRMVIRPQFHRAWPFAEGMGRVYTVERGTGYIDKNGRYVWGPLH